MLEKRPDPDEEYREWEYPDPEDVADLANLPFEDEPQSSGRPRIPIMKIGGAFMLLAFVGSLLLPLLGLLNSGGEQSGTDTTLEDQVYQQWIGSSVSAALNGYEGGDQVQYLGVQFGDSVQDPIVGILSEDVDTRSGSGIVTLQGYSLAVLQDMFSDERAQSVTLVWLGSTIDSIGGKSTQEVVVMIGMLRQTAEGIDWASIGPADLRYVADFYQERSPTSEGSL